MAGGRFGVDLSISGLDAKSEDQIKPDLILCRKILHVGKSYTGSTCYGKCPLTLAPTY